MRAAKRANPVGALERTLRRRFRVSASQLEVDGHPIEILHPASAEDLINEADFDRDERLPYWAEIWPSARVLAAHLLRMDGQGRRLMELGCGAGLVAASAALAGFAVHATDYYNDALLFTKVNVWRQAGVLPDTRHLDWRHPPRDLGSFEVIVASDVLYELPYAELVARTIARALAPGGMAIVADPGRVGIGAFLESVGGLGLGSRPVQPVRFVDGSIRQTIRIHTVTRPAK